MKVKWLAAIAGAVAVVFTSGIIHAVPYSFESITNNSAANAAIGAAQLWVDVTGSGSTATFTFHNDGPAQCTISEIFFDDGHILGSTMSIVSPTGVSFVQGPNNGVLPGGNTIGFETSEYFNGTGYYDAQATNPAPKSGVNPGETVAITFSLINGNTFEQVISDLDSPDDLLRVGLHVINFANGGSEAFVNNGAPVPEPGTMILLGTGLIGLAGLRKKLAKQD